MPRSRPIREATGNERKVPLRQATREQRHLIGLTSSQVDLRAVMQHDILTHDALHLSLLEELCLLLLEYEEENLLDQDDIDDEIDRVVTAMTMNDTNRSIIYNNEMLLFDVIEDVPRRIMYYPPSHRTFEEWSDRVARGFTGYVVNELIQIARYFDLAIGGDIRVEVTPGHNYVFGRQEIFLFSFVKIYSGMDNCQLADLIFGGNPHRWTYGFKWFLWYVDERYIHVISFSGLAGEVDNFPRYARAIARKINMQKFFIDPETGERINLDAVTARFDEDRFGIFSFVDGTYKATCTPGSGPDGDYEGSMRRLDWYVNQRSVYNGYKRIHGLHLLTVLLPTGINYVYGPSSARGGDMTALAHSQLNNFLMAIQNGRPLYATHGDLLFPPAVCISRNHKGTAIEPLTNLQKAENYSLNLARISIEHSYGFHLNKHKILRNKNEFKLMNGGNPHAIRLLRVSMLLANIDVCMHGSQINNRNTFCCPPPTLEEYLANPRI